MRIVFFAPRFLPEIGGVEKHINSLARELIMRGNNVTIITCTYRKDFQSIEGFSGIQVYRFFLNKKISRHKIGIIFNLVNMWFFLTKNFRLLLSQDIIHIHDIQTFLWILPFLPLLKKPIFITFHGFESYPIPKFTRIIRKVAEKVVDGNICVGSYITKWYTTKPDYVILGGVEIPKLPLSNPAKDTAVFIGRLEEDTGILEFLEALKFLKDEYGIEIPLHICGDGSLRQRVIEYAKNYNLKVFLHGFVNNSEDYLMKCRYAFVSGYLSILEAMVHKRLVFTIYNNPLKRDYLYSIPNAENLIFITKSPRELTQKLIATRQNRNENELILEKAYEFACKQTWKKVANIYLKLYQKRGLHIYHR